MRSKLLLCTYIGLAFLTACSSNSRRFKIIGNIADMPEQTVILEQLNANDLITIVDSERTKSDGHFELSGISPEQGLYRLRFNANKFILLSIDKGNIKIDGNWNTLENYSVNGSPSSEDLKGFIVEIRNHLRDFNTMSMVLDTLQAKGNDSLLTVARNEFMDMRQHFTQFVEHYADTESYEPNAVFAARILDPKTEKNYLDAFSQSLNRRFPNTRMTKEYADFYARTKTRQKQQQNSEEPHLETGSAAPEVALPDFDGKIVSLSSLRGKYVLLDFWASWCNPCRQENPNVVAAYEKFKDKNFTVFAVSLDNQKDAWQRAVQNDHLNWTQVSDLKGWSSAAVVAYGVHAIPTNFLIDPAGKIIGHDLRGDRLEQALSDVLKK